MRGEELIILTVTGADVGHRLIPGDKTASIRCRFGWHSSKHVDRPGYIAWQCVRCGEETRLKIPRAPSRETEAA